MIKQLDNYIYLQTDKIIYVYEYYDDKIYHENIFNTLPRLKPFNIGNKLHEAVNLIINKKNVSRDNTHNIICNLRNKLIYDGVDYILRANILITKYGNNTKYFNEKNYIIIKIGYTKKNKKICDIDPKNVTRYLIYFKNSVLYFTELNNYYSAFARITNIIFFENYVTLMINDTSKNNCEVYHNKINITYQELINNCIIDYVNIPQEIKYYISYRMYINKHACSRINIGLLPIYIGYYDFLFVKQTNELKDILIIVKK